MYWMKLYLIPVQDMDSITLSDLGKKFIHKTFKLLVNACGNDGIMQHGCAGTTSAVRLVRSYFT